MDEADSHKTAFCAGSSGLYEFIHMPFGLSNTGASFCCPMEMFYLNNICVFSSTINEMLDRIALVLNHLRSLI